MSHKTGLNLKDGILEQPLKYFKVSNLNILDTFFLIFFFLV